MGKKNSRKKKKKHIPSIGALKGTLDITRSGVGFVIIEWERNKKPFGEVVEVLDVSNEHDFAMKEILLENGFPVAFPADVIEESERLPELIGEKEIKKRKDCRDLLTFTIDPIDAKDFD